MIALHGCKRGEPDFLCALWCVVNSANFLTQKKIGMIIPHDRSAAWMKTDCISCRTLYIGDF